MALVYNNKTNRHNQTLINILFVMYLIKIPVHMSKRGPGTRLDICNAMFADTSVHSIIFEIVLNM